MIQNEISELPLEAPAHANEVQEPDAAKHLQTLCNLLKKLVFYFNELYCVTYSHSIVPGGLDVTS